MINHHIHAALARERRDTLLAEAETDRRARTPSLMRKASALVLSADTGVQHRPRAFHGCSAQSVAETGG